ncbi:MAG: LLM class flavin-dependent oxidoreductase, partial [Acidimicrobiia bacterium]|nr:LLM class flavin-dependent oxidoreductase [Acidimicrobiia bacterium]
PLPHTTAPEPRITGAIEDLSTAGQAKGMDRSLQFAIDIVRKAEDHGFITTLIAARHLGPDLEAWTMATALAMQTRTIEIMAEIS